MTGGNWRVRLSITAEADIGQIVARSGDAFGEIQARAYAEAIAAALAALQAGPDISVARKRPDIGEGVRTLHIAHCRRRARHIVVFQASHENGASLILVLRILHDAMDIVRHLPPGDD